MWYVTSVVPNCFYRVMMYPRSPLAAREARKVQNKLEEEARKAAAKNRRDSVALEKIVSGQNIAVQKTMSSEQISDEMKKNVDIVDEKKNKADVAEEEIVHHVPGNKGTLEKASQQGEVSNVSSSSWLPKKAAPSKSGSSDEFETPTINAPQPQPHGGQVQKRTTTRSRTLRSGQNECTGAGQAVGGEREVGVFHYGDGRGRVAGYSRRCSICMKK